MSRIRMPGNRIFLSARGYLIAAVLVALATWLKYLAQPSIIPADVPILYIAAIVLTAAFFGLGPSIFVCIVSLLAYDFFFIPPLNRISLLDIQEAPIVFIFLLVGIMISYLSSNLRKKNLIAAKEISARKQSEAELVKYRDHLEDLVKQRTTDLEKANLELKGEISVRKKAEENLKRRTLELEVSNKELEAFSYSVSHDLRAPLRSMDGFSQALLEDYAGKLDDGGKQYLNYIRSSSQLMARLIDDILTLSRVARATVKFEEIDLSELATQAVIELKRVQPERHAEFKVAPGLKAAGDKILLKVVFDNLLGNALKFTGQRSQADIEFGAKNENGQPVYFVRDNGAGFDMKYADRLFKPFQRLHSPDEYPGTGIGLASVQRIIHRHGGRIWAESAPGKGAIFYFTLGQ
jgi:K+-sensing histidine kinase KdpD